jgi:hypothetical protein
MSSETAEKGFRDLNMKYLRIVATDAFSMSAIRLMNLAAHTSPPDSASAHTILSDAIFVKGHDSMQLQIARRSGNELRIARKT